MKVEEVTQEAIGKAITGMVRAFEAEYQAMSKEELAERWFFKFQDDKSIEHNMYFFFDRLALYAGSCRRWEELHNGNCCVVERVRDEYVIPKIKEFSSQLKEKISTELDQ